MGTPDRHLVVDVGNSGTKAACFVDDEPMLPVSRLPAGDWAAIDALATNLGANNIIYSTVANVPSDRWIDKWKRSGIGVYTLDRSLPLPFTSAYETMETLGQDRIAAVAGTVGRIASSRLIVDAGSCVTLDLVNAHDHYLGGNISPGTAMRLRSMHAFTARIPLVEAGQPRELMGQSTRQALLHGGQLGVVYEIEGLYGRLLPTYRDLQLVLTGGDAPLLLPYFSIEILSYPNLVLRGLNQILSTYVNTSS